MSNIDITIPPFGDASTEAVRNNFATAASEIDAATAAAAAAQATANSKLSDAPNDGGLYARMGAAWTIVPAPPQASTTLPGMNGAAAVGVGNTWARADHVHPSDTSRAPLASPAFTGTPTAPDPTVSLGVATKQYVDAAVAVAPGVARSLVHNGRFRIAQRPNPPYTQPSNYNLDRWVLFLNATGGTDTSSITQAALTDADRSAAQDESAVIGMQNVFVGTPTGNAWQAHRVEGVRSLGGKTVNVSFWAKATVGTPRIGVSAWQYFGSGGAPSAPVGIPIGITPALSGLLTRYSFSVALPSTSGKIVGNNSDDSTEFEFWYSNGANDPRAAGLGQQSGTVTIWGVKVEIGTAATPLEPYDAAAAMVQCQRFYRYVSNSIIYFNASGPSQAQVYTFEYASMRARPTVVFSPAYTNAAGIQVNGATGNMYDHVNVQIVSSAAGAAYAFFDMSLSADI